MILWLNTSDESKETDVIVGSTRQQDDYYDQASHAYLHMTLLRMQGSVLDDRHMSSQAQSWHNDFPICRVTELNSGSNSKQQQRCILLQVGHLLFELGVDGQDLRVAHKGKRQDGDGVGSLEKNGLWSHHGYGGASPNPLTTNLVFYWPLGPWSTHQTEQMISCD